MRLIRSALLLSAIAALAAAAPPARAKDTLTIGVAQFPASMHPYISSQTVQFYTIGFGIRPISAFDNDGQPTCLLCTELPTLKNGLAKIEDLGGGKQGMAVTIKLKPELKWGDGQPVTARDLAFTWKLGSDPAAGWSNNYVWTRAKSVDVVDDHTAVLHLDHTYTSFQLWDYILPEHIEGPVAAKSTATIDYINHTTFNTAPTTPGLWNGPYVISRYVSGDRVEMTPNPFWAGKKPALTHIVVRLVENTAALQANLLSGDVDMTPAGIGITTDQAVELQKSHAAQFQFFFKPGLQYERIVAQQGNKQLADLRVRQALLLAIDRKTLIGKLFGGHATIADTWINSVEPRYTPDVESYPYDPAKAHDLLQQAGYTPGPDGICQDKAGNRLSLEFATTSGNRIRELSQQVMQSQWKSALHRGVHQEPAVTLVLWRADAQARIHRHRRIRQHHPHRPGADGVLCLFPDPYRGQQL